MLLAFISIQFNREDDYRSLLQGLQSHIVEPGGSPAYWKGAGQQYANMVHAAIRFKVIEARAIIDKA